MGAKKQDSWDDWGETQSTSAGGSKGLDDDWGWGDKDSDKLDAFYGDDKSKSRSAGQTTAPATASNGMNTADAFAVAASNSKTGDDEDWGW